MRALEHILNDVEPLAGQHTVAEALEWMQEFKLSHLPWLEAGKLVGLVSEEDLLSVADPSDQLAKHREKAQPYFLREQDHLFNAMHLLGEANLTLLPVVDEEERYLGYLSPLEMIQDLGREVTFAERGSLLVLQVHVRDYHLSQITQIVESEDAHIIGLHLQNHGDGYLKLVLKINRSDLSRIVRSFERFEYQILELYHESIFDDSAADRYGSLLKYLNI